MHAAFKETTQSNHLDVSGNKTKSLICNKPPKQSALNDELPLRTSLNEMAP